MVNWSNDKNEILLQGVFEFCDIKSSAPLLKYLAEKIGDGCTAKAVSHRLSNMRKSGKPVNSTSTPSTPRKALVTAKGPRTPVSARRRVSAKKTVEPEVSDEELGEEVVLSPLQKRKRTRTPSAMASYAESEATSGDDEDEEEFVPEVKKVKTEPVEEGGGAGAALVSEEDDEGVSFV